MEMMKLDSWSVQLLYLTGTMSPSAGVTVWGLRWVGGGVEVCRE